MYVIRRLDQGGGWVTDANTNPTGSSYTHKLQNAKRFPSREAAQSDLCPGNEIIERVDAAFSR